MINIPTVVVYGGTKFSTEVSEKISEVYTGYEREYAVSGGDKVVYHLRGAIRMSNFYNIIFNPEIATALKAKMWKIIEVKRYG